MKEEASANQRFQNIPRRHKGHSGVTAYNTRELSLDLGASHFDDRN